MDNNTLTILLRLIEQDKLTEVEAERLVNAVTRLDAGLPTGRSVSQELHTRTK